VLPPARAGNLRDAATTGGVSVQSVQGAQRECVISGSGLFTPPETITNEELVASQCESARRFNAQHADEIASGRLEARVESGVAFIEKASGIERRYVMDKTGVLDVGRMRPRLPLRSQDEPSIQCEISVEAIREALDEAGRSGSEVDAVIVACSNLQRPYPAVAVEVQAALGAGGWAYDLNVACSSATFGIQAAVDSVAAGHARCALVVNPEITSGHNNFELRDSHFIFGDACTAVVVEPAESVRSETAFEILGTRLETVYSNNIRNDFGFLNFSEDGERDPHELLFHQDGRRVFKEVCPMVATHIEQHVKERGLDIATVKRLWLHQANLGMNQMIGRRVLGRDPTPEEAPTILDEWANTSSAGSVIAFHRHKDDFSPGDWGVLCAFGAGYSIGSAILRRT
jgi:beta-ketodecanoyl-[acyl-carrier-protein] synthase